MNRGHRTIRTIAFATAGVLAIILCVGLSLVVDFEPRVGVRSVEEWMFFAARPYAGQVNGVRQITSEAEIQEAVKVLRQLGPKAEPTLIRNLKAQDPAWGKRYEALYKNLPESVARHLKYPVPAVSRRQDAMKAIGKMGRISPGLEAALRAACEDPDPIVQERAAAILAYKGSWSPETVQAYEKAAERKAARDFAAISNALSKGGFANPMLFNGGFDFRPNTIEEMIADLERPYFEARYVAANALQRLGPAASPAVPALIRRFDDPNASVRNASIAALGQIGTGASNALPALKKLLQDKNRATVQAAEGAIQNIEAALRNNRK